MQNSLWAPQLWVHLPLFSQTSLSVPLWKLQKGYPKKWSTENAVSEKKARKSTHYSLYRCCCRTKEVKRLTVCEALWLKHNTPLRAEHLLLLTESAWRGTKPTPISSSQLYSSARTATTKPHELGGLNNSRVVSHGSGGWNSKIKVSARLAFDEDSLPSLETAAAFSHPHMALPLCACQERVGGVVEREREREIWRLFLCVGGRQSCWIGAPHLWPHLIWITSLKTLSKHSHNRT